ncbi:MAG: glycogen synthase, partial [Bacteroidetes bacterium]
MKVLHIATECYPAAKAGGMGDVLGALPQYLNRLNVHASVLLPKYRTPWLEQQRFEPVFSGELQLGDRLLPFHIERVAGDPTGFPLFVADMPGLFDRPGIYAHPENGPYPDWVERNVGFQRAALEWLLHSDERPDLLHCHDHHSGLIPFLVQEAGGYEALRGTPTVFTIHNGQYHGAFDWRHRRLLPSFDPARGG